MMVHVVLSDRPELAFSWGYDAWHNVSNHNVAGDEASKGMKVPN
jgi:hypothetical protein